MGSRGLEGTGGGGTQLPLAVQVQLPAHLAARLRMFASLAEGVETGGPLQVVQKKAVLRVEAVEMVKHVGSPGRVELDEHVITAWQREQGLLQERPNAPVVWGLWHVHPWRDSAAWSGVDQATMVERWATSGLLVNLLIDLSGTIVCRVDAAVGGPREDTLICVRVPCTLVEVPPFYEGLKEECETLLRENREVPTVQTVGGFCPSNDWESEYAEWWRTQRGKVVGDKAEGEAHPQKKTEVRLSEVCHARRWQPLRPLYKREE